MEAINTLLGINRPLADGDTRWGTIGYAIIALTVAGLLTLMDRAVMFVYLPYWLFAAFFALLLGISYFIAPRPARFVVFMLVVAWLLVLPAVRWNHLKSFYIDADRLQAGMTLTEAQAIMQPYVQQEIGSANGVMFIPSMRDAADQVTVYVEGETISRINISPD
jgi:hypothetical protein